MYVNMFMYYNDMFFYSESGGHSKKATFSLKNNANFLCFLFFEM